MPFCKECGQRLDEGWAVCPGCGTRVDAAPAQAASKKMMPIIIGCAIVVIVVVAICVMVALGLGPFSGKTTSAENTEPAVSVKIDTTSANTTNAAAENASPEPTNAASDVAAADAGLSAANAQDCYEVNLFLSNFTEKGKESYQVGSLSADSYAKWAYEHCVYNDPSVIEQKGSVSSWPQAATNASRDVRISSDVITHYVSVFFKVDIDTAQCSKYPLISGYNYFQAQHPDVPQGVAHTTAITSMGNGQYRVAFDVYGYTGCTYSYDVLDESLYSSSADELLARFSISAPLWSGTAVIEEGYDGIAPFKLMSLTPA